MQARTSWVVASGLIVLLLTAALVACTGSKAKLSGADLTCSDCHNDSTLVLAKTLQWEKSVHATGGNYVRATSASCAGCHSSEGFTKRIAAGINPDKVTGGETNP